MLAPLGTNLAPRLAGSFLDLEEPSAGRDAGLARALAPVARHLSPQIPDAPAASRGRGGPIKEQFPHSYTRAGRCQPGKRWCTLLRSDPSAAPDHLRGAIFL